MVWATKMGEVLVSTTPDNSKAYVWQDGDAFRAPAGTALPAGAFGALPLISGTAPNEVNWDPFGGIQAGFERTPDQETTKHRIFNYREAAYAVSRGPLEQTTKFRAVDYSKASVLTVLSGGSITETAPGSGIFEWLFGDGDEFAFLCLLAEPSNASAFRMGFYTPKATLATPPPQKIDGTSLDGWDLEIVSLAPLVPITNINPLAITPTAWTVTITGTPTGGDFTLTVNGQMTAVIAHNAAAAAVKAALEALSTVTTATVTGSAGGPYAVTLANGGTLSGSGAGLTGGSSPAVSVVAA